MTNVVGLPSTHDAILAQLEQCKRDMHITKEFKKLDAELKRAHYDALIEQGFTASEALYIIVQR